ncbi:hypothetical protein ACFL23_04140 [Patescibacteria group bacterium]
MKVINARTGNLQEIPFSLGEEGRGRRLEEVKISNRPGQIPSGPDDVGYFVFGQERKHVILTKSKAEQLGILLRVSTYGTYTRNTKGSVTHKGGDAKLLTKGEYAFGQAGGIGSGTDELWHVESPSIFIVNICGGSYKGFGHRYLIVTRSFRTVMIKRDALCQLIATDEDPEVTEVVRQYSDQLHEDIQQALKVAGQLEEQMDAPQTEVIHHYTQYKSIENAVKDFGFAIPAVMGDKVNGVSGVQARTLLPGDQSLVFIFIGPGGGKRYGFETISTTGLSSLKERCERPCTQKTLLSIVEETNWHLAWTEYKDGKITAYVIADKGGIHKLYSNDDIHTESWSGITASSPSLESMKKIFNLKN